jgi:hypothetical protein
MPTVLTGAPAGSSLVGPTIDDSVILQNTRIIDMNPVIQQLEPDAAPLTTMLQKMTRKPAFSQKVEWIEDELLPRLTANVGGSTNVATTITVTAGTGQYFRGRDLVQVATTGENLLVTSVATDTLTVVRGVGSVVGTAITAGDQMIRLGNASHEGAYLGEIKVVKKVAQYNYCQIQRNPFGVSETLAASRLYGGSEPEAEAKKKMIEHKRDMENTMFFGRRNLDTTSLAGAVAGITGGLIDYITASTNIGGALTSALFETFLQNGFRYGSRRKVFFCSPVIASALSGFALSKLAPPSPNIDTWGVSLSSYQSAQGDQVLIAVKRDWLDFSTTLVQYGGWGFLVDMDNVQMRPLRSTVLKPNRQRPDEDSNKQEILTEWAMEINLPAAHRIMKGVTG